MSIDGSAIVCLSLPSLSCACAVRSDDRWDARAGFSLSLARPRLYNGCLVYSIPAAEVSDKSPVAGPALMLSIADSLEDLSPFQVNRSEMMTMKPVKCCTRVCCFERVSSM